MKDYQAYLFDCDGTIIHTLDIWVEACQKVLANHGVTVPKSEIGPRLGQWELMLQGIPQAEFKQAVQEVIAIAHPQAAVAPMYDGVKMVLQRLKAKGKKLALITASDKVVVDKVLEHHNLQDVFDLVVTADDVSSHKPDPEGVLYALRHFNVNKNQAVMLGDSDKDLGAAQNADIDSILFYPPSHEIVHDRIFLESFKPIYTINRWSELAV